jgi:hypothetical protein
LLRLSFIVVMSLKMKRIATRKRQLAGKEIQRLNKLLDSFELKI